MAKTKRIVEDLREEALASKEILLEELERTPKPPRIIKMKGITNELNDALVSYLQSKPYAEVAGLLTSLSQSPVLDVTVTDGK